MKELEFRWERKKPEDFIVKEISEFPICESGNHYLYLLAKRNMTTLEVCRKFNLSYAGMKDKFALTFQKVSSAEFLGSTIGKPQGESWFLLKFIGKVRKKVRIGNLKGNLFAVNLNNLPVDLRSWFINYYDVQRVKEENWRRGKEILFGKKRKLNWRENFLVDSYLSYLWNRSFERFLKDRFPGYYVTEKGCRFFIPSTSPEEIKKLPKFWTILGYKKKLLESEEPYREILKEENISLESLIERLRELKIKGDYRMTYVEVRKLKLFKNRLIFELPKGSFATMFLKHIQRA